MTIRTTPELPVSRHRGADTGVVFTLAPALSLLFIGQIFVTPDSTQSSIVGDLLVGTLASPGRVDLRAPQALFNELLALAKQPNTVRLVLTLQYDDATAPMTVKSIACRLEPPTLSPS